jgi:hypothetical protein
MGKYTKRIMTIFTVRKFCTPSSQWTTFLLAFIRALCHYRQPAGRTCREISKKEGKQSYQTELSALNMDMVATSVVYVLIT